MKVITLFSNLFCQTICSQWNERWILKTKNSELKPLFAEAEFYLDGTYSIPITYDSVQVSIYSVRRNKLYIANYTGENSPLLHRKNNVAFIKFRRKNDTIEIYRRRQKIVYTVEKV